MPAMSGYRPDHNFGLASLVCAVHQYVGCVSAAPGETVRANMWFAQPDHHEGRLSRGSSFTVQEGSHVVGQGVVIEVLNAKLLLRDA